MLDPGTGLLQKAFVTEKLARAVREALDRTPPGPAAEAEPVLAPTGASRVYWSGE